MFFFCMFYVGNLRHENLFINLKKKEESEEDMLDMAYQPNKFSRLSCQMVISDELDGLIVKMPSKQG